MTVFRKWNASFVPFVEVAELEMIEVEAADPAIDMVRHQIRDFYRGGFELGLHLHPQWYNAHYENGKWQLDYKEYNLCTLPRERIVKIVDRSIAYLRNMLNAPEFTPFAYRAGNWLFQPTEVTANVLADRGIKVDSSVFKGGIQHQHKLDYCRALRNGYYWKFLDQVDTPDPDGTLLELPIYTQMVPTWKMLTTKRLGMQRKNSPAFQPQGQKLNRLLDLLRFRYPLKLDFCRMTINELTQMVDTVIKEDRQDPVSFRPIVAIGHTKDLDDFETVESFLTYLRKKNIVVSTFEKIYHKCMSCV